MNEFKITDMLLEYIIPKVIGRNIKEFISCQMNDASIKRKNNSASILDYEKWINK